MDKKNLRPQQAQPVNRIATGQLPSELMELSEEALSLVGVGEDSSSVLPLAAGLIVMFCSYDGDDAE